MILNSLLVLGDGLTVLGRHYVPLVVFAGAALGCGALAIRLAGIQTAAHGRFALMLGLGCSVLPVLTLPLVLASAVWPALLAPGCYLLLLLAIAGVALEVRTTRVAGMNPPKIAMFVLAGLAVILLLLLRLAFLKNLLLPPYDDSPEHYLIIKDFLSPGEPPRSVYAAVHWPMHYYHLGFHSLAAWLTFVTGAGIGDMMALLGQSFLLIAPLSVYAFVLIMNGGSRLAAWTAAIFAAIGWRMPAFAANWGKYPALLAVACLPVVLSLPLLVGARRRRWLAFLLAACGLLLVHTRAGVCLALGVAGFVLAGFLRLRRPLQWWQACSLTVLFVVPGFLLLGPLFYLYSDGWYLALGLVVLCLPFAIRRFPQFSVGLWFVLIGVDLLASLSLPAFLQHYSQTLLDRTFVEILLFLPLSLLAGMGLAGFLEEIGTHVLPRWAIGGVIFVLLGTIFWLRGSFYPDPCCNYVRAGDLDALAWIQRETPPDAVVLVAGFEMRNYQLATDGGGWVQAMTNRNMNKVRYHLNWGSPSARELTCKKEWNEPYIYAGGMELSFVRDRLFKPEWYRVVFESQGVRIYKVQNCQNHTH